MTKRIVLFIILAGWMIPVFSQYLIGLPREEVLKEVKKNYPGFVVDLSAVNNTYKYLKFVDKNGERTLLAFLSETDFCTSTKLMSDYLYLKETKSELNKKYKKAGPDKWTYTRDNKVYLITLKQEEWFFTLFTGKK